MFVVKLEMKIGTKSQDFAGIITRAVCLSSDSGATPPSLRKALSCSEMQPKHFPSICPLARTISCVILVDAVDWLIKLIELIGQLVD
jgi:hypothetical protein